MRWGEWRFSPQFSLHCPLISWSQIWHGDGCAHFCQVLFCGSVGCFSVRFLTFPPSLLVWSSSSLVSSSDVYYADECWSSDSQVTMTPISLPDDVSLSSSSVMADSSCLWRSFTWRGLPLTSTVWGLITPSTCPLQNLVVNLLVPQLYITSDFRQRRFGVYAYHPLLILVYAIRWHTRWCFVIFGCCIIPVHSFRCWATRPCGYSLGSAVILLRDTITFWDRSTSVSHSYALFVCWSKESLATKSWGIIR